MESSSNAWWVAFFLTNSAARIARVTLDGNPMSRDESGFWSFSPSTAFKRGNHMLAVTAAGDAARTLTVQVADVRGGDLGVQF